MDRLTRVLLCDVTSDTFESNHLLANPVLEAAHYAHTINIPCMSSLPLEISYLGEDDSEYFRRVHDRILNTLNPTYMLPADRDEAKVCFRLHYMY